MRFSKSEILLLEQVAKGNKLIKSLALALKLKKRRIYIIVNNLVKKNFIRQLNGNIEPKEFLHVKLFLELLATYPNLSPAISESGIPILTALLKVSKIEEISRETGFKKTTIYTKLAKARKRSIIKKVQTNYKLNEKLWKKLIDFLVELNKYELMTDKRIPSGSTIYYKKDEEIIFASKQEVNAERTAFSTYEKYGIKLLTVKNYYYLPKKKLTKEEILKHSIYIFEKTKSIRDLIYIALFYAKFKNKFKINHEILKNLNIVLQKGIVKGYPSYQEIKDRAEIYEIKV
jgi:predicted transcriptional regulator